jgi:hypothetical protein
MIESFMSYLGPVLTHTKMPVGRRRRRTLCAAFWLCTKGDQRIRDFQEATASDHKNFKDVRLFFFETSAVLKALNILNKFYNGTQSRQGISALLRTNWPKSEDFTDDGYRTLNHFAEVIFYTRPTPDDLHKMAQSLQLDAQLFDSEKRKGFPNMGATVMQARDLFHTSEVRTGFHPDERAAKKMPLLRAA